MSSITEGITYVEPAELVAAIEGKRAGTVSDNQFVVIDVREPWEISRDGAVVDHVSIPSEQFSSTETAKGILRQHLDKDEIVVHCLKSQQRGPTCALALSRALQEIQAEEGAPTKVPEIKVLRGGYSRFSDEYGSTDLVVKPNESSK